MIGIQKVECLDNYLEQLPEGRREAAIAFGTEFEAPIYAYRGKVSSANVLGVIHPYRDSLSCVANYGLVGSNAHLKSGPSLEEKTLKVFFYEGPDGLSFFTVQNKPDSTFATKTRIFFSTKKVSLPNSVLLSNDPGDLELVNSPSANRALDLPVDAKLFDGEFDYNGRTAGGIIGYFEDTTDIRDWEVTLDPMDTGDLVMIKAADGKNDSEVVLAQGPVKIDFDYSLLREKVADEDLTNDKATAASAYGNLYSVDVGAGREGPGWFGEFVGQPSLSDPSSYRKVNPYSLFDGTVSQKEPDLGAGLSLSTISLIPDQNVRWWRDYVPKSIHLVTAVGINDWYKTGQYQDRIEIYSKSQEAYNIFIDESKPIIVTDLRALCTSYDAKATTFSITIVDDDGNYFVFPDRTIVRATEVTKVSWVSFGSPDSNEAYVIESDPSTLESPPSGTIIGTKVTGSFKKTLDLRKVARVIVDLKRVEGTPTPSSGIIFGIQSIAAMLDMPRWVPGDPMYLSEPNAYAIIEAFARYWRFSVPTYPTKGWPTLPTNVIGRYTDQWWPPKAVDEVWHIIPGFTGDAINCASGAGVCNTNKYSLEEIRNNRIIFTTIPPNDGCQMYWKQVEWLERGHRIGASCSFFVEVDGMSFIIVKRSIGVDTTCGGGESEENPCVVTFGDNPMGHPAIAWPSIDGEEFIGKPTSGYVTFIKDDELSGKIMQKLLEGNVKFIHGDPNNTIPFVLFPSI